MATCKRCKEETSSTHTNADIGFSDVCDDCQREAWDAARAARAARRAAALGGGKA
jgi:hypothetical protein